LKAAELSQTIAGRLEGMGFNVCLVVNQLPLRHAAAVYSGSVPLVSLRQAGCADDLWGF
jgi:hypothetical protein